MRELNEIEFNELKAQVAGGLLAVDGCTGFVWYLLTSQICCRGTCYNY